MLKILAIMMILAAAPVLRAADAGALSLRVETNRVELTVGSVVVRTLPDSLRFTWLGPYGNFSSDMGGAQQIQLDTIDVVADADHEKRVVLTSKPTTPTTLSDGLWKFTLILAAQRDRPGVLVQFARQNVGDMPVRKYYFFKLVPIHFPFYYDADGEQYAGRSVVPMRHWMFWPTANTLGGYGIIFSNPEAGRITTLFPRSDWRRTGWYFSPGGDSLGFLAPGESHTISFWLLPAVSPLEVAAYYDQFKLSQPE